MAMTVQELIEALQECPSDAVVILQRDAEGNGYSPAAGAESGRYVAETKWSGQVLDADTDDDEAIACVCIWPIN